MEGFSRRKVSRGIRYGNWVDGSSGEMPPDIRISVAFRCPFEGDVMALDLVLARQDLGGDEIGLAGTTGAARPTGYGAWWRGCWPPERGGEIVPTFS